MLPDIRLLEAFHALCSEGSFTRAAERVGITQPALSKSIHRLERIIGSQLVIRHHHSIELTPIGQRAREHTAIVLRQLDQMMAAVTECGVPVRLGFSWSMPVDWLDRQRDIYERAGGHIKLRRCDDPLEELDRNEIDIAIHRHTPAPTDDFARRIIGTEQRVAAVHSCSTLAQLSSVHWDELRDEPLVVNVKTGSVIPAMWPDSSADRVTVECNNVDEWLEHVAADHGVGVGPAIARIRAQHPSVTYLDVLGGPKSPIYLTWRRHNVAAHVQQFLATAFH